MKLKAASLSLLILLSARALSAPLPSPDPIAENLFPPDLILQHQIEIDLTEPQRLAVMTAVQTAQERMNALQPRLQSELETLAGLLKSGEPKEDTVMAQLDRVIQQEREIRRTQLRVLLEIRKRLTAEQQAKLVEIKGKIAAGKLPRPEEIQRGLQEKLGRVQQGIRRWQDEGRDPFHVEQLVQDFDRRMRDARTQEAEGLLDRALMLLSEPKP